MNSIGIFGGSFDPFHDGHLHVIVEVAKSQLLSKLLIIPNYQSPFKANTTFSSAERIQKILDKKHLFPKNLDWELCDWEIKQESPCPTIKTVEYLKHNYPKDTVFSLILGSDSFFTLHTWHQSKALLEMVNLIVVRRDYLQKHAYEEYAKKQLHKAFILLGDEVVLLSSSALKLK